MVDKPLSRTGKRDAPGTAPSEARGAGTGGRGRGERRGGFSGNDGGRSEIPLTLQKQGQYPSTYFIPNPLFRADNLNSLS